MKSLFIYYSLSGNGDIVAKYLKEKDFEIRKIESLKKLPKRLFFQILAGGFRAGLKIKDKLSEYDKNIDAFDKIYIGTPVWNGQVSCPINRVLDDLDLSNKDVTLVLYSGSGKAPKIEKLVAKKYPNFKIINLQEPQKHQEQLTKLD